MKELHHGLHDFDVNITMIDNSTQKLEFARAWL